MERNNEDISNRPVILWKCRNYFLKVSICKLYFVLSRD